MFAKATYNSYLLYGRAAVSVSCLQVMNMALATETGT